MAEQLSQMLSDPTAQRAFNDAQKIVETMKTVKTQQKQEAMSPFLEALRGASSRWQTATTDTERQAANNQNNQVREKLLAGGFSPSDVPAELRGADPNAGFQTTQGFSPLVTGYEGLGRKETMSLQRQALLDAMTNRTQEAGLTGIDPKTGSPTWERQYQERSLAKSSAGSGGSSGGTYNMTEAKRLAWSKIMDAMQADVDDAWKASGDQWGSNAPGTFDALDSEYMKNLSKYNLYGITEKDIQSISDIVRKRSGFGPKYNTKASEGGNGGGVDISAMTPEQLQAYLEEKTKNPQ